MSSNGNGMSANVELVEPTGFGIILHLSLHGLPFKIFTLNREALTRRAAGQCFLPGPVPACLRWRREQGRVISLEGTQLSATVVNLLAEPK